MLSNAQVSCVTGSCQAIRWFTGRHDVLTDLARWLCNSAVTHKTAIVTGNAGSGKTALLGLLAALSDPDQAPAVPVDELPTEITLLEGTICEAIYAGTMTTSQVRERIAAAVGLLAETTQQLIDGLNEKEIGTTTILIDAIDEAANPQGLIRELLNPLIRHSPGNLRLLLGTRPYLLNPTLLGKRDSGLYALMDLDSEPYADPDGIRRYIKLILLSDDSLDSAYRPSGIYREAHESVLDAAADAIGQAAGNSFLVARITAATEATATRLPDPKDITWRQGLPRRAGPAMYRDLRQRLGKEAARAEKLLLPLAYAQGSGMPWEDLWPRLANKLSPGNNYDNDDLVWLRTAAGSYAVESRAEGRSVYRLYHQALTDYLREKRDWREDEHAIAAVLVGRVHRRQGGGRDWANAHPYIRTHLATHVANGGHIDELLTQPGYLLAADRPQLLAAAAKARSAPAQAAADAYRHAAHYLRAASTDQHPSYLQLAAYCGRAPQLAVALDKYRSPGTWSTRWASWRLEHPNRSFPGHDGPVQAVAVGELDGRPLVASGSGDESVRVWDLATGQPVGDPLIGHDSGVLSTAVTRLGAQVVVISGCSDHSVRVWDLATAEPVGDPFMGHTGAVESVAVGELDGRPVVVSGSSDHSVRVWDLATGEPVGDPFMGHTGAVESVAVGELDGRPVVVSGSSDQTVHACGTWPPDSRLVIRSWVTPARWNRWRWGSWTAGRWWCLGAAIRQYACGTWPPVNRLVIRLRAMRVRCGRWRWGSWIIGRWWFPAVVMRAWGCGIWPLASRSASRSRVTPARWNRWR